MHNSCRLTQCAAALLLAFSFNASAQTAPRQFDIPAGELKTAIDAYAQQSGIQLVYKVEEVRGLSAGAVKGAMAPEAALALLLKGTSLQIKRDQSDAVVIFRSKSEPVDTGAKNAAAEPESGELQVVTVTAQKRPESAQSVPISMTTMSSRTIERFRISSLQDVSRLTPGLLVSQFSQNSPTVAIRGANNTFSQMGVSKPVAVVIDDVFIPRNSAANFELFDLDSIAVLKGPQGTLFGRNVTGGAIVMTTRKPSLDSRNLESRISLGNYSARHWDGLASVPLGDAAAFKISASLRKRAGIGRDRLTGAPTDDIDSKNVRTQLLLAASPGFEALLSADIGKDDSGGRTLSSVAAGADGDRRTAETGVLQGFERSISGASAKLSWQTGVGELLSISALRKSNSSEDFSGVGANFKFLTAGAQSVTSDRDDVSTFSQEFRYTSPKYARFNFITGLYYLSEDGERALATRGLAAGTGVLGSSTLAEQGVKTRSVAVFVDGVLNITPQLDLALGARYTRDRKIADLVRTDFVVASRSFTAQGLRASWNEVTPRAALTWRPVDNAMAYVSVSKGFTAGGFNTDATTMAALTTPFNPETVKNMELGFKSQWLSNRLRLNASFFNMAYRDKQEFVNNSLTGILSIINASEATIKGAEVELAYKPWPWLNLAFNYGHLDTVYDRFVVGNINYTGNPLASSPKDKASLAADVSLPTAYGHVFGTISHAWTDTYNTGAANDPNLQIPGYALTNLTAGIEALDRRWKLTAWIKNANDTDYILTRSTQVVRAEYLGDPRTYGLTLAYKF
ncbi:MAG: TonB-dependent receptor [Pseudomonadota bacterium]